MNYNKINSYKELVVGEWYWLKSKEFESFRVSECLGDKGIPNIIFGHWVTPENHEYTFDKYEIFGPILKPN